MDIGSEQEDGKQTTNRHRNENTGGIINRDKSHNGKIEGHVKQRLVAGKGKYRRRPGIVRMGRDKIMSPGIVIWAID